MNPSYPISMDGFATHLSATITCAIRSGAIWPHSPILELGCGHYSTPLLSSIAKIQNRKFKVITSSAQWAQSFSDLACEFESIEYERWPDVDLCDAEWGMVLIDNEESSHRRFAQLFKLPKHAKVVVLHDANRIDEQNISWGPIQLLYEHLYFFERYQPSTAILSQEINPKEWFE
jgi:hypothetical protein